MNNIIGRENEINRLQLCMERGESQFVVVYGRRRVGKTFLIREFFHNEFTFNFTGIYNATKDIQLANFTTTLQQYWNRNFKIPGNWVEAFRLLREYLEEKKEKGKQRIVFIDELPWLDTQKSDLLTAIEIFWNHWAAWEGDIKFIVCGSATSWITDKILNNTGGLYNRCTMRLFLNPFNLHETELFLQKKGINWTRYDIALCYMIMGGIPYYLNLLQPDLPLDRNIDELFFVKKAKLWDEHEQLYKTLFKNANEYITVVEALATKRMGLTRNEILAKTGLPNNGLISKVLDDLTYCDFIRKYNYYGNRKRDSLYQLSDFYSMFYYKFIKGSAGKDEHFWSNMANTPERYAWAGNAFEQLCKDHVQQIKKRIGISAVLSEYSSWFCRPDETYGPDDRGAQVDLVIDRMDRVINLCEMKFSSGEYEIDKDYEMNLRNKIERFRTTTNTRKALHLTMVTTFGVKRNKYSGIVQSQVTIDDLFSIADY